MQYIASQLVQKDVTSAMRTSENGFLNHMQQHLGQMIGKGISDRHVMEKEDREMEILFSLDVNVLSTKDYSQMWADIFEAVREGFDKDSIAKTITNIQIQYGNK